MPDSTAEPESTLETEDGSLPEASSPTENTPKVGHCKTAVKRRWDEALKKKGTQASKRPKKTETSALATTSSISLFAGFFDQTAAGEELAPSADWEASTRRDTAIEKIFENVAPEKLPQAKADKKHFDAAVRKMRRECVKPADEGKWSHKGMQTTCFSYQIVGAGFIRGREKGKDEPHGGILADQMGLGKTITMLTAIADGRPDPKAKCRTTLIVVPSNNLIQWHQEIGQHCVNLDEYNNSTPGIGRVLRYKYLERQHSIKPVREISECDIVLTTYHEVQDSFKRSKSGKDYLHQVDFLRICLDEAHMIRNEASSTSKSCRALKGLHNWAITGTPLLNSLEDFYAIFDFINHPLAKTKGFKAGFKAKPAKINETLEGLLKKVMIRRTYNSEFFGARLVTLPPTRHNVLPVPHIGLEKMLYVLIRDKYVTMAKKVMNFGDGNNKRALLLRIITRPRQMVSHPMMVQNILLGLLPKNDLADFVDPDNYEDQGDKTLAKLLAKMINASHVKNETKDETKDETKGQDDANYTRGDTEHGLWSKFEIKPTASQNCISCSQPARDPQLTPCHHVYCKTCIEELIEFNAKANLGSPYCKDCNHAIDSYDEYVDIAAIGNDSKAHPAMHSVVRFLQNDQDASEGTIGEWLDDDGKIWRSAKVVETVRQIRRAFDEDPKTKLILFTQWMGFVKVLARVCEEEDWGCLEYVGKMSANAKQKVTETFESDGNKRILIASLRSGGVGLNLKMASKVILLDHW